MQRKLWIVFGFVCVLFVVLIGRIMYIEYTSGDKYTKIVLSQQDYTSTIIPYQRGDIVDSKGTVLATSVDVYNVILDCKVLNANESKIDSTIQAITTCIPEITEDQIRSALKDKPSSEYVILAKKVSAEEEQNFQNMLNDEDTGSGIAGDGCPVPDKVILPVRLGPGWHFHLCNSGAGCHGGSHRILARRNKMVPGRNAGG